MPNGATVPARSATRERARLSPATGTPSGMTASNGFVLTSIHSDCTLGSDSIEDALDTGTSDSASKLVLCATRAAMRDLPPLNEGWSDRTGTPSFAEATATLLQPSGPVTGGFAAVSVGGSYSRDLLTYATAPAGR